MPADKSLTSYCFQSLVILGMLGLLGHTGVNFWEKMVIKNELTGLKTNLQSLKENLHHIGNAYDCLYNELTTVATQKKIAMIKPKTFQQEPGTDYANKFTFNEHTYRRYIDKDDIRMPIKYKINSDQQREAQIPNQRKGILVARNATTITRKSAKSTGVGSDESNTSDKRDQPHKEKYIRQTYNVHKMGDAYNSGVDPYCRYHYCKF